MTKTLIGWAEESLVPDKKVSLPGQFYERISQYVESEITATAMAVEADGEAMIMVSADLTSVPVYVLDLVREKFAKEVADKVLFMCDGIIEEEAAPEVREADPVEPVKDQVNIDDFAKLDFRVCKVLKAEAVRKSHSCLKLTLFDGIGERVIMSSIKEEYTPEMLVGRKIIVFANLKPNRICNVNSQGMLLAATNNACGCKVIFVDDSVPAGTRIG